MKKITFPKFSFLHDRTAMLKPFFLSRAFREKVLLLAFVLIIAATWLASVVGRTSRLTYAFNNISKLLVTQRYWLDQQARIEASSKAAVQHLDPAKTYDGAHLQSEIAAIASRLGLNNYTADSPQPERTSQFSVYTMGIDIRNADYPALVKFYLEIAKQTPYIGIDRFRIVATNGKHAASLRVSSVEISK
jgi:hypothetical protein